MIGNTPPAVDRGVWTVGREACRLVVASAILAAAWPDACAVEGHQYAFEGIVVPAAKADEPTRDRASTTLAIDHLEQGSVAWSGERRCISCHTNGTYMLARPALAKALGPPPEATRGFFLEQLQALSAEAPEALRKSTKPAQVIYLAAGLASWDRHVSGTRSAETDAALSLLFSIQEESGTWGTLDCWPPYESDAFHEATVAATAAATAPGWLDDIAARGDSRLSERVERLRGYLRDTPPPHDYGHVLLLQASTRFPGILDEAGAAAVVEMIRARQKPDGGWSIRAFAAPEAWGGGNRAAKLRAEPDVADPASDGHMTGLAVLVLREAGVPADDPAIGRGVAWLLANQRVSGRWWTRSLNTDSWHFITYSGTALPLLALDACDALPQPE